MKTTHTEGPWKVMPHPLLGEKHPFHQSRFITTADAVVEIYDASPDVRNQNDWDTSWGLRNGVIICETKDSVYQEANARLIAAAPDLLAALRAIKADYEELARNHADAWHEDEVLAHQKLNDQAREAIAKARVATPAIA